MPIGVDLSFYRGGDEFENRISKLVIVFLDCCLELLWRVDWLDRLCFWEVYIDVEYWNDQKSERPIFVFLISLMMIVGCTRATRLARTGDPPLRCRLNAMSRA